MVEFYKYSIRSQDPYNYSDIETRRLVQVLEPFGEGSTYKVKKVINSVLINLVESCPSQRAKLSDVAAF